MRTAETTKTAEERTPQAQSKSKLKSSFQTLIMAKGAWSSIYASFRLPTVFENHSKTFKTFRTAGTTETAEERTSQAQSKSKLKSSFQALIMAKGAWFSIYASFRLPTVFKQFASDRLYFFK